MRGKTKLISLAAVLAILLSASMVFASGFVDVSRLPLLGAAGPVEPDSPGTLVFVDPPYYVKDYPLQPVDSTFTVHINISDFSDLYTWQINMTWDKAILNVSRIIASEFLARSDNLTSSEVLGLVINASKVKGTAVFSETILGIIEGENEPAGGITGRLVSIEFLVMGYGSCDLVIVTTGKFNTTLVTSTGVAITPPTANGYFSNKIIGDVNGDQIVDGSDFSLMGGAYRSTPGDGNWNRECDVNHDGIVDGSDFSLAGGNYRRSVEI